MVDTNGFEDLIREYKKTLPEKLDAIEKALEKVISALKAKQTPEWKELERLVHKLAGSAGTYGFGHISQQCIALEEEITSGRLTALPPEQAQSYLVQWQTKFSVAHEEAA